jgi:hypothetical protein
MIYLISILSLTLLVFALAPDFYFDVMIFGKQLDVLPKSYLVTLLIPVSVILYNFLFCRYQPRIKLTIPLFFLLFLVLSSLANLHSQQILLSDLIKNISQSFFIFLLSYLTFAYTSPKTQPSLLRFSFSPFLIPLLISSVSAFIALYIYQLASFTPTYTLTRFTSTSTSQYFLNPYIIDFFGFVESIPYKSFFARSTWFVLEPIHFSFYLLVFYALSILSPATHSFKISTTFLLIGLLCTKSVTSLFAIIFTLLLFIIFKTFRSHWAFLLGSLVFYLPFLFYALYSSFIVGLFSTLNKATNYREKVLLWDSIQSFFITLLWGSQSLETVSHNLAASNLVNFGFILSLLISFSVLFICFNCFSSLSLSSPSILCFSIMASLIFVLMPSTTHPLYSLAFAYIASSSMRFSHD